LHCTIALRPAAIGYVTLKPCQSGNPSRITIPAPEITA
jgi:hypothetical protein